MRNYSFRPNDLMIQSGWMGAMNHVGLQSAFTNEFVELDFRGCARCRTRQFVSVHTEIYTNSVDVATKHQSHNEPTATAASVWRLISCMLCAAITDNLVIETNEKEQNWLNLSSQFISNLCRCAKEFMRIMFFLDETVIFFAVEVKW